MITINRNTSLYDIVAKHPDVKDIMFEIGFEEIIKPGMLTTVGRFMTIEKGAKSKNIEWTVIEKIFKNHGYVIDWEK